MRQKRRQSEGEGGGRDLYLYIPYFVHSSPLRLFAFSFHLVTSLRLVTARARFASSLRANAGLLPLTANGLDPFSNDAPGRSPRYPFAASRRIVSLRANLTRRIPRTPKLPEGRVMRTRCGEEGRQAGREGQLIRAPGTRCGQSFRRYDEVRVLSVVFNEIPREGSLSPYTCPIFRACTSRLV